MVRPKANPEQYLLAYRLWKRRMGPAELWRNLAEKFADPISERTLANWVKQFKELNPETVDLDSPFEWHRMEEAGLAVEASGFLLRVWHFVMGGGLIQAYVKEYREPPTFRQMRWYWRIHQAAPEFVPVPPTGHGLYLLSQRGVQKELRNELLGERLETTDLMAYMAFRPWNTPQDKVAYDRAVLNEIIPALAKETIEGLEGSPGILFSDEGTDAQESPADFLTKFLAWTLTETERSV